MATLENIPAGEVSKILAQQGYDPEVRVTVLIEEDLSEIARRMREKAKARGMTKELFDQLMASKD